jgi:peroxiredoxin
MNNKNIIWTIVFLVLVGVASCSKKSGSGEAASSDMAVETAENDIQDNIKEMTAQTVTLLEIGAPAPDFDLKGSDGKNHKLSDYAESEVLVIVFTCNHCPTAQAYEERIKDIVNDYNSQGVAVVAISPNAPEALLYEECGYSDLGDTFDEMVIRARDHEFNFPYLYDGDDHAVSLKFGPVATPHAFVFDKERKLKYTGRIDASEKPGTANAEDLRNAINAVLKGETIAEPVTKSFGCSVKWAWKNEWTKKVNKDWNEQEVTLEQINEKGIADLLKNDSEKLRLINIWATWCGPCVIEYPEFVVIHRMFSGRDFEFVSLSADKPDHEAKALKFLQEKHSAVKNYIFDNDDVYKLIEAVDPEWNGALPYTLLIEPGGEKVYTQMGVIDPLELKRTIVDHPMIGRYY